MPIQIDTGTIIASGVTLVLSSAISYFIYGRQKNVEFSYDYRKYILEKRKAVYDSIEDLVKYLEDTDFGELENPSQRILTLAGIRSLLLKIQGRSLWVGVRCQIALWDVRKIVQDLDMLSKEKTFDIEETKKYRTAFWTAKSSLLSAFFYDIARLDKIGRFKAEKEKNINRRHNFAIRDLSDKEYFDPLAKDGK
jgi:hypothetical protein